MSTDAILLAMQAPRGLPRSNLFEQISDPLLPPSSTKEMLAHFHEAVYDTSPQTHLARLLKVLLGETGTGGLRKKYTYSHLSQFILTAHFNDLDRFYASIFGLKRFIRERINFNDYDKVATDAEWEAINAADAAYRNRIEAFSRSIAWAGTPTGMVLSATSVLGEDCRVYESYDFIDNDAAYAAADEAHDNQWGDLEAFSYRELDGRTYASLEGTGTFQGRLPEGRGEFIVRPLRNVTDEEKFHLTRVLSRLKPAEAMMTIDDRPVTMYQPLAVNRASASSSYWHVRTRVQVDAARYSAYDRYDLDRLHIPVEQPKPAFSAHQGEAWAYNSDVIEVSAYAVDEDGTVASDNFERHVDENGAAIEYRPEAALQSHIEILMGRAVSDGILTGPVADREDL